MGTTRKPARKAATTRRTSMADMRRRTKSESAITALNYIDMLASTSGTNISTWDIKKIFCDTDGKVVTNQAEINKRFFEQRTKKTRASTDEKINDTVLNRIATIKGKSNTSERERQRKKLMSDVSVLHAELNRIQKQLWEVNASDNKLDESKGPYSQQLQEVLRGDFYDFVSFKADKRGGGKITLTTRPDIILRGRRAGTVNLGKYKIVVDLPTLDVSAHRHKNNKSKYGYIHPYISGYGEICWGSAYGAIGKAQREGRLDKCLTLMAALLTQYSDSTTPFCRLEEF